MLLENIFFKEIRLAGFVNYDFLISFTMIIIYSYIYKKRDFVLSYLQKLKKMT